MSKQKFNTVVVAHPDDETIFFAGLIQKLRTHPWRVLVATDGNATGSGAKRFEDLRQACKKLGVKEIVGLGHPDIYVERLKIEKLRAELSQFKNTHNVFTHSIVGDYGHPHHQDVSLAVTQAFESKKVFYIAQNCLADKIVKLNSKQFKMKCEILSNIYFSETSRFQNLLPARTTEEFARVEADEIQHIFEVLNSRQPINPKRLKKYLWYIPYLEQHLSLLEHPI